MVVAMSSGSDRLLGVTYCSNPECRERLDRGDDAMYRVQTPDDISMLGADVYCSARCVARGMVQEDGVDRVNVYDSDESGVTPGGVTDDD